MQGDVSKLPKLLESISDEEILGKQQALGRIWHRFLYADYPFFLAGLRIHKEHEKWAADLNASLWQDPSPPKPYAGQYHKDDAFSTIVQWLYSRLQA